eukprot:scaffold4586_cov133-Cylindrotheca_fusiformis.AAC.4
MQSCMQYSSPLRTQSCGIMLSLLPILQATTEHNQVVAKRKRLTKEQQNTPPSPMPDTTEDSEYTQESPRGNMASLSQQSQKWDTDNKGYLSKSERQAKEFDKDGKGYLNQEEARSLGRKIAELNDENNKIRKILLFMILLVIVLCGATIASTYFAIKANRETKVDDNGRLVSANGGAEVAVKGQGLKIHTYRMKGANNSTKTCVAGEDLENVWNENRNGGVATIVIQNEDGYEQVLRLSPSDSRMTQDVVSFGDVELYPDPECHPDGASSGAEDGNRRLRDYVQGEGGRRLGAFHYVLSDSVICYFP